MSASDATHSHEVTPSHPHRHDEPSIISELNDRFTELRSLIITIGSILALLMTGLHQSGIDFGIAWLGAEDDDPDITPHSCEESWSLNVNHYVIEYDALFNVELQDDNYCNTAHTIEYYISLDGEERSGVSPAFRNQYFFAERFHNLSEGTHHAFIEVENGTIDLFENVVIDFDFDEGEQEQAIYGCTDPVALNYNETATHDDGSCEYEQEEEEVTEDCDAFFYSVNSYWYTNNTTNSSKLLNDFDVDFSCMANVTVTVTIDVYINNTTTTSQLRLLYNGSSTYDTYHYDWDYHYIDFFNVTREDYLSIQFRVYYGAVLNDEKWYWLEG